MARVSIILPFYNPPLDFFKQAVDSVLAQTYDNWELLLLDDGSEADVSACAQAMAEQDSSRIKYIEHDNHRNLGASANRNVGLEQAQGEYLAFQDADDVWMPEKLQRQTALLDSNQHVMATFGNTLYWHSWTGHAEDAGSDYCPRLGIDRPTVLAPPLCLHRTLQRRVRAPCITSLVVRRDALERLGGFEDAFGGLYDDQVFYSKIWLNYPVLVVPGWLEKYRQHPNSMCAQAKGSPAEREARTAYLDWLTSYVRDHGLEGTPLWRQLEFEHRINALGKAGSTVRRLQRWYWRIVPSNAE